MYHGIVRTYNLFAAFASFTFSISGITNVIIHESRRKRAFLPAVMTRFEVSNG